MTNGTIPGFVPTHLNGKVDSFRKEPDGRISFRHDAAGLGEFGDSPGGGRKYITPEQYNLTFDPAYRITHLADVPAGQYGGDKPLTNPKGEFTDFLASKLRQGLEWGMSSQGKSVGAAGLLSALAGGIGGTIMARRSGEDQPWKQGLIAALLTGVAGSGVSAAVQNHANRRNDFMMRQKSAAISDEAAYLRSVILGDSRFSSKEKADILKALSGMREDDREDLAEKARALFGFSAGMYIARALISKGLIPSVIGGIIGAGLMSSGKSHNPKMNAWGQLSNS